MAVHEHWVVQDSSRKQCHGQISGALDGFQDYNMITAMQQPGTKHVRSRNGKLLGSFKKKYSATIWQCERIPLIHHLYSFLVPLWV